MAGYGSRNRRSFSRAVEREWKRTSNPEMRGVLAVISGGRIAERFPDQYERVQERRADPDFMKRVAQGALHETTAIPRISPETPEV